MGFAASQARFLSLTARMSDVEYESQQILEERLVLSGKMEQLSNIFCDATANQILTTTVTDADGVQSKVTLSYNVITKDLLEGGMGYNLITSSGLVVVPSEEEMQAQIEKSKNGKYPLTEDDFFIYKDVVDTDVLQKQLEDGNFCMATGKNEDGQWKTLSIESSNATWEYDKTDDAAAQAVYDKEMKKLERQDAMLQARLQQLDMTHNALSNEIESLDKLIKDDVEKGFKTFG